MDRHSGHGLLGCSLELIIIDPWELHAADGSSRLAAEVIEVGRSSESGADQILIRLTAPLQFPRVAVRHMVIVGRHKKEIVDGIRRGATVGCNATGIPEDQLHERPPWGADRSRGGTEAIVDVAKLTT